MVAAYDSSPPVYGEGLTLEKIFGDDEPGTATKKDQDETKSKEKHEPAEQEQEMVEVDLVNLDEKKIMGSWSPLLILSDADESSDESSDSSSFGVVLNPRTLFSQEKDIANYEEKRDYGYLCEDEDFDDFEIQISEHLLSASKKRKVIPEKEKEEKSEEQEQKEEEEEEQEQSPIVKKKEKPGVKHVKEKKAKEDEIARTQFNLWSNLLSQEFSVLLFGVGSKFSVLQRFGREVLCKGGEVIVVRGFTTQKHGMDLCKELVDALGECFGCSVPERMKPQEKWRAIAAYLAKDRMVVSDEGSESDSSEGEEDFDDVGFLFSQNSNTVKPKKNRVSVILHNIDGLVLRDSDMQSLLSDIARYDYCF